MRKLLIAAGAIVVVLVVSMFLLPYFIDVNQYHGEIQTQFQNRLHRSVQFGGMSLGVLPLRVQVQAVNIGEDPRFHWPCRLNEGRTTIDFQAGVLSLSPLRLT